MDNYTALEANETQEQDNITKPMFPDLDYAVIDGNVVLLQKTKKTQQKIFEDVKVYYKSLFDAARNSLITQDYQAWRIDWDSQLRLLSAHQRTNTDFVKVPRDLTTKPIVFYGNKAYEARSFIYKPNLIRCNVEVIRNHIRREDSTTSKLNTAIHGKLGSSRIVIKIEQDKVVFPCVAGLVPGTRIQVGQGFRTYHTYEDGKLCIGNAPNAEAFWNHENFVDNMNTINPYSPAASSGSFGWHYMEFFKDPYIVDIIFEKESVWKTQ